MNGRNVRLILFRELRDQLRDRRMMVLFVLLPVSVYPLVGMLMAQMGQFSLEHPTRICLFGSEHLPDSPALVEEGRLAEDLVRFAPGWDTPMTAEERNDPEAAVARKAGRMQFTFQDGPAPSRAEADQLLKSFDLVVVVPADFRSKLDAARDELRRAAREGRPIELDPARRPSRLKVYYNSAQESSDQSFFRIKVALRDWSERYLLTALGDVKPAQAAFELDERDLAGETSKVAAWSAIFPMLLVMWSLTGAFQPAIDIVAGEKERGTLETLLSSPVLRLEIVWGKLLTVMLLSVVTVLLNLVSMAVSGAALMANLPNVGPPPAMAAVWLLLAMLPLTAMFSALCLALAAFSRSVKEANYYLMPMFLVVFPLVLMAINPGAKINLGISLVPIAGLVRLLRALIEGSYAEAWPYVPVVLAVTIGCAWASVAWAVDLFSRETVLFREAERFDLRLWIASYFRRQGPRPTFGAALGFGVLLLTARFFLGLAPFPAGFTGFVASTVVLQLTMLLPALALGWWTTTDFRGTFRLRRPGLAPLGLAVLLAVALHPLLLEANALIQRLYPLDERMAKVLLGLFEGVPLWSLLLLVAVLPAVCEETTYRGFVLSGMDRGRKWRGIVGSSLLFALAHGLWQQALLAFAVGLMLGYIAQSTRCLWLGMLYHVVHNGLLLVSQHAMQWLAKQSAGAGLVRSSEMLGETVYRFQPSVVVGSTLAACLALYFLLRLGGSAWYHKYENSPPA